MFMLRGGKAFTPKRQLNNVVDWLARQAFSLECEFKPNEVNVLLLRTRNCASVGPREMALG